ncbi:MAG: glycerophosphodiester phosphodiesterase [Nitrosomonas sp.]|nr:glycerophosphodiester phosphodiesterase [Nitrosomonas sp.]MDP1950743.1 glycerophosphodiester phosphodiesterase [Nitrosomonas sp.]
MNNTKHCLIFAHRGANREAAENTRTAFDKALEYAVDGIETDVQLTRDEITVLWHDNFLGKAGLPDKHIDDFTFDQLKTLDFSSQLSPHKKHTGVMSLQAFLEAYRTRCRLLIEIKNREWESTLRHEIKVRQTLNIIGSRQNNQIVVSSFNLASLVYAHQYKPEFPLIYNFKDNQTIADAKNILAALPFFHGLCLPISILNESMVELLRDHGKCLAVYTCNSDEEINKALELGVDILISDLPHKALMMRDA